MHMKKSLLFLMIFFITGCFSPNSNIKVAGAYGYPESGTNKEVYDLIVELTSSNFFQYTQAARKLISKGEDALEMLFKYRHLYREVDGSKILVCVPIIEIILKQSKTEWLRENSDKFQPSMNLLIRAELEKRTKGEDDGRPENSSRE